MTPKRDSQRTGTRSRLPLVVAIVSLCLVPVAVGVGSWLLGGDEVAERRPKTIEIVVPDGTQARLDAGEKVAVMPSRLEFRVGDTILIRNNDAVTQYVGPYKVGAKEKVTFTFGAPGVYSGYCPLSDDERYEIVVTA